MAFGLFSLGFDDGGVLPVQFTADGADRSPPLTWTDPPEGTASFALLCHDPDAPRGPWYHWAVYDIPPVVRGVEAGGADDIPVSVGKVARNDFGKTGYGGPAPPPSHGPHRYIFRVLALDLPALRVPPNPGARDVEAATAGHILAEARMMGRYGRRSRFSR